MSQDTPHATGIDLPGHLREQIRERIEGTEFDSVEEYVTFTLEQVLAQIDRPRDEEPRAPARDTEGVEERLESLGYL